MKTFIKPNPHNAKTYKLGKLTPAQRELLIHWLRDDGITYAVARERILKEFGIIISNRALCQFWQRSCFPIDRDAGAPDRNTLLNVVIKPSCQVRLIVNKNGISLEY